MEREWEKLQQSLRCGMRRRDFLAGAAALGVSAATANHALAQVPKRGGHLIMGLQGAGTTDSLDPATYRADFLLVLGPQLYDYLIEVDENMKLKPSLAMSWDSRPGAKEWIFKLNKGVLFHNGKEMTSADVVRSFNHHRGDQSRSMARIIASQLADIKATDRYEVTMTLREGNLDWPSMLIDRRLCIGPEETNFTDGIGTGAYKLQSFEPGVVARTTRNSNDWRPNRGYVESVETLGINDPGARLNALLSQSVHLIDHVPPTNVEVLEKDPRMQVFNTTGAAHQVLAMHIDVPPFDNKDFRLALKYGIDREGILKRQLSGYGRLGNDHPIPSFDPFFAADIPQRPFDLDKARFHYKKSGHSGPIPLTFADSTFTGALNLAQIFKSSAARAGIDIQLDRIPNDNYWTVRLQKPFAFSYWGGRPTADLMLSTVYGTSSAQNETHWRRPDFEALLVAARVEQDQAKRKQMYHDMQFLLHEDGGAIIPSFVNFIDAGVKRLKGFIEMPSLVMCNGRAAELVWFES